MINCVRGWLRTQRIRVKAGGGRDSPSECDSSTDYSGRPRCPTTWESMLCTIEHHDDQIRQADKRVSKLAKADANCRRG